MHADSSRLRPKPAPCLRMILKCWCAESCKWARSRRQGRRTRIGRNGSDMQADGESIDTVAVHGGECWPGPEGSVVFPIYQSTVFSVEPGTGYHDISYIRLSSNPSQRYLHDKLAALEGAQAAVATASGMAAVTTALLSVLQTGDHLLASDCLYCCTHAFPPPPPPGLGSPCRFPCLPPPQTPAAPPTPHTPRLP